MIEPSREGAVVRITLNRPERRNALNADACAALAAAVRDASETEGVRAIVLTGAGTNFCAGADLSGVEDETFARHLRSALDALVEAPVPTIAAVHGAALGAGTQVAVACDLRIATPDARFGIPAAKLGLMVDQWTVQRVTELAGGGPARLMLLAAEEIDGETAFRQGLVQKQGGVDEAMAWAEKIAALAPLTIAGHKLAINGLATPTNTDPVVQAAFSQAWQSEDLVEGMASFRERRAPEFRGR